MATHLAFKLVVVALSRIVIPSAAEGSFLHYGQYHIGNGRETTPWCELFKEDDDEAMYKNPYEIRLCD